MEAAAWSSGSGTFGIRVGAPNRALHFDRSWSEIEVEVEGRTHHFALTPGFWKKCPEFRDSGTTVIRDWLTQHYTTDWPTGHPPRVQLQPLGGNRFRLVGPDVEPTGTGVRRVGEVGSTGSDARP